MWNFRRHVRALLSVGGLGGRGRRAVGSRFLGLFAADLLGLQQRVRELRAQGLGEAQRQEARGEAHAAEQQERQSFVKVFGLSTRNKYAQL